MSILDKEAIFCDTITNYVKSVIFDLPSNTSAKAQQLKNHHSLFRKKLDEMLHDLNELKEKGLPKVDILEDLSALEVSIYIIYSISIKMCLFFIIELLERTETEI